MAGELVLLTGGTGFLGYSILVDLLKSGYRVRAAARSQAKIDKVRSAPSISALNPSATQLTFVIVPDMTTSSAYDEAVQGVDFIIHAAAPVVTVVEGSTVPKEQLQEAFVTTTVQGNLGILKAAHEKGNTVRRIVITSSTVAIAPVEVFMKATKEHEVVRGPESRITVSPPPYDSELEAYCSSKAAALNASEAFVRDNAPAFDLISILPSWISGKDELITDTAGMLSGSTSPVVNALLTGSWGAISVAGIGNAVLCSDAARAHVKALDPSIEGNQSFIINTDAKWEDTVAIAKKIFPDAFEKGVFKDGASRPTIPFRWDTEKTREVLGIELAPYETMTKEVAGQYLELAKQEGKY